MVTDLTTVVYYGLDDGGQPLGLSGMGSGDTLSPTILDEKVLNASSTMPAMVGGSIVAVAFSSTQPNTKANSTLVYDADGGEYVSQVPAFVMEAVGGGPFEQPVVVTSQDAVTRVNINATLSGGDAYFGNVHASGDVGVSGNTNVSGYLGVSGDTDIRGDLFVSGDTVLSGTLVVSSCPFPAPFAHARLTGAGTAATAETHIGAGATISQDETGASQVVWNDTSKEFDISAAGTWGLTVDGLITGADTTIVTMRIKQTVGASDSILNTKLLFVLGGVPWPATISAVFDVATTASIWASLQDDGSDNIQAQSGTTMTLRRLR